MKLLQIQPRRSETGVTPFCSPGSMDIILGKEISSCCVRSTALASPCGSVVRIAPWHRPTRFARLQIYHDFTRWQHCRGLCG
jgi:hypothetical protein